MSNTTYYFPLRRSPYIKTRAKAHDASMTRVSTRKTAVLLIDDRAAIRQGLRALLKGVPHLRVIGEAENGRQAIKAAKKTSPDVVVMDLSMPVLDGLAVTRQILEWVPQAKVLVLISYGDETCVERLMEAGVVGFLIKQTAVNELVAAIRQSERGNTYFSPIIAQRLRHQQNVLVDTSTMPQPAQEWRLPPAHVLKSNLPEVTAALQS